MNKMPEYTNKSLYYMNIHSYLSANELLPGEGGVSEGRGLRCGRWTVTTPEGVEPRHERRVILEAETMKILFVDFLGRCMLLFTVRIKNTGLSKHSFALFRLP